MYRLIGIYHGSVKDKPGSLPFDDSWYPTFSDAEMTLGYETKSLTFLDFYFVNGFSDMLDILPDNAPQVVMNRPSKCSTFVKRTKDDIFLAHNSWTSFLDQSQALTL